MNEDLRLAIVAILRTSDVLIRTDIDAQGDVTGDIETLMHDRNDLREAMIKAGHSLDPPGRKPAGQMETD